MHNRTLGLEELGLLISNVTKFIEEQIIFANRTGQLNDFLTAIGYGFYSDTIADKPKDNLKILVIGESKSRKMQFDNVAIAADLLTDQFDYCLSYEDIEKFDFRTLRNSTRYDYVFVGPMAHRQRGVEGGTSAIAEMESDSAYPVVIRLQDAKGRLKLTPSTFNQAIEIMLQHFDAHAG